MSSKQRTMIFVHGMYMNGSSWEPWIDRARSQGFSCEAPSWPFHQGEPSFLRDNIDSQLGHLNFRTVVDYYKSFIDTHSIRPILIGHSIGGLVVQKLVTDGYGSAAVCISSAPPQGVLSFDPQFFRANFPHVNPLVGNRPVIMTKERFHYSFCNTMSREASDIAFEKHVVPESRNIPRSTLSSQGRIDFKKPHMPLLFLMGDQDHLTPSNLVTKNFNRYQKAEGVIDYRVFVDRSHFICNQEGWEEVADSAFGWIRGLNL